MSAYYVIFQFSHAYTRLFSPWITKRLQNVFNVVTKQRQNWNIERIMQFFRIAAYVQITRLYSFGALCGLCILPYINGLRSALVGEYSSLGCLCILGLYGRWESESVGVFDGFVFISVCVDVRLFVNVFIYYNCMGCLSVCVYGVYMIVCALVSACCLGGDWWNMATIRRELNLFVNWYCDCMCICMCLYECICKCIWLWLWIWKMFMYMIYSSS